MAIEEFTEEPTEIRAGDSIKWRVNYDDFTPDDGWSLSYKITSHTSTLSFDATTENNDYVIHLTAAQSAVIKPGRHDFIGYVTKGTERATVFNKKIEVLPDLAAQDPGYDNRSQARKTLALLDDAYAEFGSKAWTQSYTIRDKAISFRTPREFIEFYNHIKKQVNAEDAKDGSKTSTVRYIVQ